MTALTPAATQHFAPKFGREHPLHMPVFVTHVEERYELLGNVAPIHVEAEQTAVLAADVASQAMQLSLVIVPGHVVTPYECQEFGDDGEHFRNGTRKEIGGGDIKEGIFITQCTQYLHGVQRFLDLGRDAVH